MVDRVTSDDLSALAFVPSDSIAPVVKAAYQNHARRIAEQLPNVEVRHVGGSSVPGLLTSGDVDLQVRVTREEMAAARAALCAMYEPLYPEAWEETAYFYAPSSEPRVEIALTVLGNVDDLLLVESWQRIATEPGLAERYNALKRAHEGGSLEDYQVAKREFFFTTFQL